MTLSISMDHHVPSAITDGLRRLGVDALTAWEDKAERLHDDALLDRTTSLNRTLFSQDEDLLAAAADRLEQGRPFAGLIYAHQLRITIGQAVRDLHLISEVLVPEEMLNQVIFLPL